MNVPVPKNPELDALLGAYVLDALEPAERARVEAYLAVNPNARAEVDDLIETAASLALAPVDDTTAPAGLWQRISAELADAPVAELDAQRARRASWGARAGAILAVAVAAVAIVLAVQVVSLHNRLDDATTSGDKALAIAFDHAQSAPGAKEATLTPAGGTAVAHVVLLPDGSGYLRNDGMKPLAPDQTYQLWALTGDAKNPTVISAGVLGSDPKAAAFRAAGPVHGFVVTVEHAPGVVTSTQPAYAQAALS